MRKLGSRKVVAGALAGLVVAGGGGAAIAASQGGTGSPSGFLDAVARHLGISSQKLQEATKAAAVDQVDAALEAGRITKEEADELKSRIESGEIPPFLGPFGGPPHRHLFGAGLDAAADYLGLTEAQLHAKVGGGQSLAEVAKAEGKTVVGLEQAILGEAEKDLNGAVADGELTDGQRDRILQELRSHIDELVNGTPPERREHRFGPGPMAPFWGTSA